MLFGTATNSMVGCIFITLLGPLKLNAHSGRKMSATGGWGRGGYQI